jgi:xylan 1,4-beta-xylosidase
MAMKNPFLTGFYPDPSICRKGDDFYVVTSSFQWFPGIPIHHSRDLCHWEHIGYALTRTSQLDLHRIGDSFGIWAPDMTYSDGLFWLIYTVVSRQREVVCSNTNYLVMAKDPRGPWCEPIYLNSMGYDPSFFHDDNGKKYQVGMWIDDAPGVTNRFAAMTIQEYNHKKEKLVGPVIPIFEGTPIGCTEGPHLYKRNDWYYLVVAEGGTVYGHSVTVARSRKIEGPYEVHPENPLLTARNTKSWHQKSGHADLLQVNGDEWAIVYLVGRPIDGKCMLGRESCIQKVRWDDDGWMRLEHKGPDPEIPDFDLPPAPVEPTPETDDFDDKKLALCWNTPRVPLGNKVDLKSRKGWLRLHALPDTIYSVEPTTFVARRIQHHAFEAETVMEYSPDTPFQHAGLVCYYDTTHWYFLNKTFKQGKDVVLSLIAYDTTAKRYETVEEISLDKNDKTLRLAVSCDGRKMKFSWGYDGEKTKGIGGEQEALVLSDDYIFREGWAFTGAFIGMAAWDRFNKKSYADFDLFTYRAREFDETSVGAIPQVE